MTLKFQNLLQIILFKCLKISSKFNVSSNISKFKISLFSVNYCNICPVCQDVLEPSSLNVAQHNRSESSILLRIKTFFVYSKSF